MLPPATTLWGVATLQQLLSKRAAVLQNGEWYRLKSANP